MPVRRVFAAYLLLVILLCVTVALGDEIVGFAISGLPFASRDAPAATARAEGRPWHEGRPRAFAVLADSLRYETAIDPKVMPNVARLFSRGARARVRSTRDAVTVPAIRAAFKGVERTELFGFVSSLFRGRSGVTSLFSDLRAEGRGAIAYSDGSFLQFGDVEEQPNEGRGGREMDRQNASARRAAAEFAEGKRDLAVVHLTYTDHAAHQFGVGHAGYVEHYRGLDALIEELDRVIAPEDTLVLFGDHGHDEQGRHSMGLDVPTFALYRGPGFRAGADLGTIRITDHRYLMSWALELPLPGDYRGGRHPSALVARAGAALPVAYAAERGGSAPTSSGVRAVQAILALLVAAGCGAAMVGVLRASRREGPWASCKTYTIAALAGVALLGWGALLARLRPSVHEPAIATIACAWVAVGIALPIALRTAVMRPSPMLERVPVIGVAVLAAPLFLFYPTVYRYGAPGAMAPVWICGLLAVAAMSPSRRGLVLAAGAIVLLFPFKLVEGTDFRFFKWMSWPVQAIPGAWTTLDLIALLVLFVRPRQPPVAIALGVAAAVLVYGLHINEIGLGRYDALIAIGLAVIAFALRRLLDRRRGPEAEIALVASVERTLGLAALLVGFHAVVLTRVSVYAQADVLLAAVSLSAPLVDGLPERASRWAFAVLGLLAVMAAGWVGLAWTLHAFEWHCVYAWFSASFVERHIGWFLPVILFRYALPARTARRLMIEGAPSAAARAEPLLFELAAAKAASLALITLGIGLVEATSDAYLEAAQQTAIWLVVMSGIL